MHIGRPLAIVLGLNEIASAVAVKLHVAGYSVINAYDPRHPVIRRGMSYFDALFDDGVRLGGIAAVCVDSLLSARLEFRAQKRILVTRLDLSELLIIGAVDVLIDARVQSEEARPQLRNLARFAVGIGSGFECGENCDAMIPWRSLDDSCQRRQLPIRASVIRAPTAGRWHTRLDIGLRIYKGIQLGHLGSTTIDAPVDGMLRGIARDDTDVPAGAELVEILTSRRGARWWGLDAQGLHVADEVHRVLSERCVEKPAETGARLRLVHSR